MTDRPTDIDHPKGFAFAVAAYLMWGALPLYMKAMSHIPTLEVLAHRVLWALPIALGLLLVTRRFQDLKSALTSPRLLAMGVVCAGLISINWGSYVYAIQSGHAMDAAIGYYINPLFSVLLGRVLLGERLLTLQWVAVTLAAIAVVILTIGNGKFPALALVMTVSWGLYAYCKKSLPLGPNQGFALEVVILLPFALGYALYLGAQGQSFFTTGSTSDMWLLIGAGVITAVPLLIYANGAKLLRLATIGLLQYLTPTLVFITALFVFDEPFGTAQALAFPLIWAAVILYTWAALRPKR